MNKSDAYLNRALLRFGIGFAEQSDCAPQRKSPIAHDPSQPDSESLRCSPPHCLATTTGDTSSAFLGWLERFDVQQHAPGLDPHDERVGERFAHLVRATRQIFSSLSLVHALFSGGWRDEGPRRSSFPAFPQDEMTWAQFLETTALDKADRQRAERDVHFLMGEAVGHRRCASHSLRRVCACLRTATTNCRVVPRRIRLFCVVLLCQERVPTRSQRSTFSSTSP